MASFFVSWVDTEVDKRLDALSEGAGSQEAAAFKGRAAVANARLAYAAYQEVVASDRWRPLAEAGAHVQRPLWASTGVKSEDYPDTLYITGLRRGRHGQHDAREDLEAFADHGEVEGDRVTGRAAEAQEVFDRLAAVGIDFEDVLLALEKEGVDKFKKSWTEPRRDRLRPDGEARQATA